MDNSILIQAMAVMVEVEGMKAQNKKNELAGEPLEYSMQDFNFKASEIQSLSYIEEQRSHDPHNS